MNIWYNTLRIKDINWSNFTKIYTYTLFPVEQCSQFKHIDLIRKIKFPTFIWMIHSKLVWLCSLIESHTISGDLFLSTAFSMKKGLTLAVDFRNVNDGYARWPNVYIIYKNREEMHTFLLKFFCRSAIESQFRIVRLIFLANLIERSSSHVEPLSLPPASGSPSVFSHIPALFSPSSDHIGLFSCLNLLVTGWFLNPILSTCYHI